MALNYDPQAQQGIMGAIRNALGLFNDTNKAEGTNENSNTQPIDPYESTLDEKEIMELIAQWKRDYKVYYAGIEKGQTLSFDYWVGKHRQQEANSGNPATEVTDNLIFEAVETFLPMATRANPEPLVTADPGEVGQNLANDIKVALAHEADVQHLRRKLAKGARGWMLNRIGVWKVSWDPITKKIKTEVINAKRMIFDRQGYIDERGWFIGTYLGEKRKIDAATLMEMFPKKKQEILEKAGKKKGTELEYYEWWYKGRDVIFTLDEMLLGKYKNPNWNYDGQEEQMNMMTQKMEQVTVTAINHLDEPAYPYLFLSIFNTGEQPHDNTSLILQNIPQQDKINRREVQIERNVEGMNNGMVVSGSMFTEDQASQAASALRKGMAIRVPTGDVNKAVLFPQRPALPADVFNSLRDARSELKNIFGTSGSTAEGIKEQETVRGKIMVNQADSSRIGGGITEYIEQVADSIYNFWVQFMFVYYDEEHFIAAAGEQSGMELVTLKNDKFSLIKTLKITVKEGSLVPKDPLTQRNEAIDLWSANAIDPKSLYKKLDFPDPDQAANQLILWQLLQKGVIQPQQYLPSFAFAGQTPGQPQMPGMPGAPLPGEQPGTGSDIVSNIGASQPGGIKPQEPVATQSQELLRSVPIQQK